MDEKNQARMSKLEAIEKMVNNAVCMDDLNRASIERLEILGGNTEVCKKIDWVDFLITSRMKQISEMKRNK